MESSLYNFKKKIRFLIPSVYVRLTPLWTSACHQHEIYINLLKQLVQ